MWQQKSPKLKIINFILRQNRTYRISFQRDKLFVDDKLTWIREEENMNPNICYFVRFIGTGPQDFRQRAKKRTSRDKRKIPDKNSSIERG